jgi:hypothetical protein
VRKPIRSCGWQGWGGGRELLKEARRQMSRLKNVVVRKNLRNILSTLPIRKMTPENF